MNYYICIEFWQNPKFQKAFRKVLRHCASQSKYMFGFGSVTQDDPSCVNNFIVIRHLLLYLTSWKFPPFSSNISDKCKFLYTHFRGFSVFWNLINSKRI